jgi:4-hydroxy-2-oxoheptanedioate aldolase
MPGRSFGDRLRAGETLIGTWLSLPDPAVIEAMGRGFDFLQIDGEHAPIPPDRLHRLLPAADALGLPAVYRARRNRDDLVSAALDAGAHAVMLPMVNSRSEAEAAVRAAKYPPRGRRGFGPWRASDYYRDMAGYMAEANAGSILAVQIEHEEAVRAVEEIASVEGVDLLYVGPADLALSMGLQVGVRDARLDHAFTAVAQACKRQGKAAGTDVGDLGRVSELRRLGFTFFTYGSDLTYLAAGAGQAAADFRKVLELQ